MPGLPNPLAVARAVRALAARRRLEMVEGKYRLLDGKPLEPGEPESVPRTPAEAQDGPQARPRRPRRARRIGDRRPTYADLGRALVDRLIELGRETGEALGLAENLRREAKENRAARIEAEQRASRLFERVKELEHKLEMAEANLRTVLAAARGRGATAAPPDNEMEAVLQDPEDAGRRRARGRGRASRSRPRAPTAPAIDLSGEAEPAEAVEEAATEPAEAPRRDRDRAGRRGRRLERRVTGGSDTGAAPAASRPPEARGSALDEFLADLRVDGERRLRLVHARRA